MKNKYSVNFIILVMIFTANVFALNCESAVSIHLDKRLFLPDGSPNPTYGQEIETGLCACLEFLPNVEVTPTALTLTLRVVDNEPLRGLEVNVFHDAPGLLLYAGVGSIEMGDKFNNTTDPDGVVQIMEIMANELADHVKVLAFSRTRAQTSGDGTEGDLFYLTYGIQGNLPDSIHFYLGLANVPGSSYDGAIMNVVCTYPDEANQQTILIPTVGVDDKMGIPTVYSLAQNFPNPFNPTTRISFGLPESGMTSLTIFNLLGQKMIGLVDKEMSAGHHNVEWNGKDENAQNVASGVYFYELKSNSFVSKKKMILLR